jgi:16S rRNA (cytidine1402-2'-O)-methyltransferase
MGKGTLFVVATPIGNLQDISPRAVQTLAEADLVVAEDTRHTRGLLHHLGLERPMQAMHEHNEEAVLPGLLARLGDGEAIALVSDAGTPLISDPGYRLVRAVHEAGMRVCAVPGPSAVTAALSVSGLPTDRFVFEGFLPPRSGPRRRRLEALRGETRTLVVFESGHRIEESLRDLEAVIGADRPMALCRELTKRFETVLHGTVASVRSLVSGDPDQRKGEFVIVLGGGSAEAPELAEAVALARELARELPASRAARVAARISGVSRRVLFDALEQDRSEPEP